MNNLVSIIVPCYNGEAFVDRCMTSIYCQDYSSIEIIVVDDGSTDQSKDKILSWKNNFAKKNYNLLCITQKNKGPGGAINTGLKYVTGGFISLLDIDDEYLPGAITERVTYMNSHEDVDVVRSNGWYVRNNGKSLFIYDDQEKELSDIFTALIEGKTNNWAGSYMVRSSALFKFYPDREIYQSRYGQNLQLLLPLVYEKKCGYIDVPHMNYNQQENSLTKTSDQIMAKEQNLENAKGYRDIRIFMVNMIIKEKSKKLLYLKLIDMAYWRSVMQIAFSMKDQILMKDAYLELTNIERPILEDKIIYCRLMHPKMVFLLKIFRKLNNILRINNRRS